MVQAQPRLPAVVGLEEARGRTQPVLPQLLAKWRDRVTAGRLFVDNPYGDKGAQQPSQRWWMSTDFRGQLFCATRACSQPLGESKLNSNSYATRLPIRTNESGHRRAVVNRRHKAEF
jgi:hypothetical protein